MSQIKGTSYKEEVYKIRDDIDRFRETNRVLAYGSEIGASIPTLLLGGAALRGAGLATKAVRGGSATRAAAVGAGQGAVYGAGTSEGELTTAEGLKDRLLGGAVGASLGGAISGAAGGYLSGGPLGAVVGGIGGLFCDVRVKEDISPLQKSEVNDLLSECAFFVKDLNECS